MKWDVSGGVKIPYTPLILSAGYSKVGDDGGPSFSLSAPIGLDDAARGLLDLASRL